MKRKIALITGASRGIGKAIAHRFASENIDLILTCRTNISVLNDFAEGLQKQYGINCRTVCCDHRNSDEVNKLFASIESLDYLINNAGVSYVGLLQDMTDEMWHDQIASNLDSIFYTCRCAIPRMLRDHSGSIINISSVWGNVGASCECAYSASKGGVNAFTKALAKELAPSGISVNAIACGIIDTDMNAHLSAADLDEIINEIPAARIGTGEDIAEAVYHISQCGSYLTGQIITVDGGWT